MATDGLDDTGEFTQDQADQTDFRNTWRLRARRIGPRAAYLTALNGTLVGRIFQLGSGRLFIGRAEDCDIVLKETGVSRRHAFLMATPDGRVVLEDLRSTNGTSINGTLCEGDRALHGGEHLQFGSDTVFKFEFKDEVEQRFATHLYESATRDRLTGLYNDRYFREQLSTEFTWHRRHDAPLSLIFIDIDHFKRVNDRFGHLAGDEVLKAVVQRCNTQVRREDIFARYGGEEFACLLRQTRARDAVAIAESMRGIVADEPFEAASNRCAGGVKVTISAGVAQAHARTRDAAGLVAAADRMLYAAKNAGRNQVLPAVGSYRREAAAPAPLVQP